MNSIIKPETLTGLNVMTDDDVDSVSGGLPLLVGWAIYAGVGFAMGSGAAYLVRYMKAK